MVGAFHASRRTRALFVGSCLHWIVPSSPLHVIFHVQHLAFSPAQGHNGFDKVVLKDGRTISIDHYTYYLHHKYFEVNYGRRPRAARQALRHFSRRV